MDKKLKIVPLKVVREHWLCECGGEFIATGRMYLTAPPYHEHRCNKCKKEEKDLYSFPRIGYVEREN